MSTLPGHLFSYTFIYLLNFFFGITEVGKKKISKYINSKEEENSMYMYKQAKILYYINRINEREGVSCHSRTEQQSQLHDKVVSKHMNRTDIVVSTELSPFFRLIPQPGYQSLGLLSAHVVQVQVPDFIKNKKGLSFRAEEKA